MEDKCWLLAILIGVLVMWACKSQKMMSDYKVIKDCGLLKKGDLLFWNGMEEAYTLDESKDGCERSIMINDKLAEELYNDGYFTTIATDKSIVKDTVDFIDNLIEQYKSDLLEVQNKFEKVKYNLVSKQNLKQYCTI